MELKDLNKFLRNNTGAKYFDADLKLFKEKLPYSKLIKDLENAKEWRKAELDERMCAELLQDKNACIDCIWENRGFFVDAKGFVKPLGEKGNENIELTDAEKELLAFDLTAKKPDYNNMKKLIFDLNLEVKDNKANTYVDVLSQKQSELMQKANFVSEKERLEQIEKTKVSIVNQFNDLLASGMSKELIYDELLKMGANDELINELLGSIVPATTDERPNDALEGTALKAGNDLGVDGEKKSGGQE